MKEYFSPQDNAPKIGFEVLILIRNIVKKKIVSWLILVEILQPAIDVMCKPRSPSVGWLGIFSEATCF